jgi:hypothetical protein
MRGSYPLQAASASATPDQPTARSRLAITIKYHPKNVTTGNLAVTTFHGAFIRG